MQRTNFGDMACSIARTLDVIGEPWSPLILRDVWVGMNRFDAIQADLGISRKVLTERLNHLVERGVLERRPYDRRPRYDYHLTDKGAELLDVLMVIGRLGRQVARRKARTTRPLPPPRVREDWQRRAALRPLRRADARG
jgi:DNA-binding HxlR family transcriptional regulator